MTVDEMERLLDDLGIEYVNVRGDEVQGFCPMHEQRTGKEDRNPSWYINAETGAHICFSCEYRGNVVSLVSSIRDISYDDALDWLSTGGALLEAFERAVSKPKQVFEELVYISEASLAAFTDPPEHALKARGLKLGAAQQYNLKWDTQTESWIIPIRDPSTGNLQGWQLKSFSGRHFRNHPVGVKKSNGLFGFGQYTGGDMIVVESPLDVVRLASIGIPGAVAVYGALISDVQLKYLLSSDRLVFALDSDEAGQAASLKMVQYTESHSFEAWFFDYSGTSMKDVGGMSKSEVLSGLNTAKHSIRYATTI
jgi:DNA primase